MLILLFDTVCPLFFIAAFMPKDSISSSYIHQLSTPFPIFFLLRSFATWDNLRARIICEPGINVIKVLHLYFTRVAIVSLAENNSCTCKLQNVKLL